MKSKLIVIEGACDGIGKSTQFELLNKRLREDGYQVSNHHFPTYNTYQGAPVEKYLKGELGPKEKLSPYLVNSLYAVDRGITWNTKLKPLYDAGHIILLDRYTTSSLIYQSALIDDRPKKREFIDWVTDFEYNKIGIKKPDQVIFLYAPFEMVNELRNNRKTNEGIKNDIHEQDLEFMKKVYDSAMFVADYLNWDKVDSSDNDKMASIEDIHNKVYSLVMKNK